METPPLPGGELKILSYTQHWLPAINQWGDLLRVSTYCDMGPQFIQSHPKDQSPCPTVGFKPCEARINSLLRDSRADNITIAPCGRRLICTLILKQEVLFTSWSGVSSCALYRALKNMKAWRCCEVQFLLL